MEPKVYTSRTFYLLGTPQDKMLEEAGLYGTRFVMESAYTSMVQAKDAEIVRLNGQIAEFNRWLSKGVYFTTEEYQQRVEQHNAEIAALTSRLAESEKAAYDVVGTIDHLKDANARLRECLVKCKRELFWCDKQLVTKGFTTGFSKTTASVKEVLEAAQHALADTDTKTERPAERGMMSKPRTTYDDAMRGVTFELIGAMSSLNMEPEPMKESTGSFLSESDTWASHAVEHIRAAIQLARKAEADNAALREQLETLKKQLPDEMQDCTIVFKECEQGHGRLIATNWIDHGCGTCALESLQAQLAQLARFITVHVPGEPSPTKNSLGAVDCAIHIIINLQAQLRQVEGERNTARHRVDELEAREIDVEILQGDNARLLAAIDEGLTGTDISLAVRTVEEMYADNAALRLRVQELEEQLRLANCDQVNTENDLNDVTAQLAALLMHRQGMDTPIDLSPKIKDDGGYGEHF